MTSVDSAYTNAVTKTRPCGCRIVSDDYHDTVIPCEKHGGRTQPMTTNGTATKPGWQHPSATLAAFLFMLALALIAAGVTLTLTGHTATDAWWGVGVIVSGLMGVHVPAPPRP